MNTDKSDAIALTNSHWFSTVIKDPLFHFIILGGGLFIAYLLFNDSVDTREPKRIVVDNAQLLRLTKTFEQTWRRQPTQDERQGIINNYLKEEILYREAIALGLDKNDSVIRRRLRQKMEFLNQDISQPPKATDAILQRYLELHKDQFTQPGRLSFSQLFFQIDNGNAIARAKDALARLQGLTVKQTDFAQNGDPTLLAESMSNVSPRGVARVFGQEFTEQLWTQPPNKWIGPIRSGFGVHLVYIEQRSVAKTAMLADVRQAVEKEWLSEQRQAANERFFQMLKDGYDITIADPGASPEVIGQR